MRNLEPWMVVGGAVRNGAYTGKITVVVTALIGDVRKVLRLYVQPMGVRHSWPVNPEQVDSINTLIK